MIFKESHIHQQGFCDGETVTRKQQVANLADKSAVDCSKRAVQMCQVNDVLLGDGGKVLEVFYTKADRAVASVLGEHGQAVGTANDSAGIVDEAGAPFQQGTGAKGIGMPGIVLNTTPHFRGQLLQRSGQ